MTSRQCPLRRALLFVLTLSLVLLPASARASSPSPVYFDDSSPDLILVGNSYYEIAFRKSNGSIAEIRVKPDQESLTLGSRWECLWGAMLTGPEEFVGGCHFKLGEAASFSYQWLPAADTLVLKYEPLAAGGPSVGAEVQVRITDERWADLHIDVRNDSTRAIDRVLLPCDLSFAESEIREAVLPFLPGVALQPAFWAENRSYVRKYPGWPGVFADLVSIQTDHGALSIYPLPRGTYNAVEPAYLGFVHDEAYAAESTYYHHGFSVWAAPNTTWSSPWVRLLTGGDWLSNSDLVRQHTELASFRSLAQKLGERFGPSVRLPLYKADTVQLNRPFDQYDALFDRIAYPGLLHPVAWQPGGHDENYPDLLPPDPRWGTTEDMAAMFRAAQARGYQVMPYSNPTWWDDEGPTLTGLPPGLTLPAVSVIGRDGKPVQETYGSHGGYVVSPWSRFVVKRVGRLVDDFAGLGSDVQLWDQVGARPWLSDFNESAPSPTLYMDGWLRLAQLHADTALMTEMGYDRLADTLFGFHGSVLLIERQGQVEPAWHEGLWRPIPLASALLGDKVLLYQHDLAPETMTHDKATLRWNLAMGYMLSADLASVPGGVDGEWLRAVGALQRYAVSRYAGHTVKGYERRFGPGASTSSSAFGACLVLANWDEAQGHIAGPHTLAASGVNISCPQESAALGELTAGVYTRFNDVDLAAGDHVIIQERGGGITTIRHPLGENTEMVAAYPTAAGPKGEYAVEAIGYDGKLISTTASSPVNSGVKFTYSGTMQGKDVAYYRIRGGYSNFLPVLTR